MPKGAKGGKAPIKKVPRSERKPRKGETENDRRSYKQWVGEEREQASGPIRIRATRRRPEVNTGTKRGIRQVISGAKFPVPTGKKKK